MIDFVIPAHPKDFESLALAVAGLKANVSCVGRIFIVADSDPGIEGTTFIYRGIGSDYHNHVNIETIEAIWQEKNPELAWRAGWIYQQLVKLLASRVIADLSKAYVIMDADAIFVSDVVFDPDRFFYSWATEYHLPYLEPTKQLLGIDQTIGFSTTAHHMICTRAKMEEMLSSIEARFGCSFVEAVLSVIDYHQISNLNEQDLWANFMLTQHPDLCHHRQLKWVDLDFIPDAAYLAQSAQNLDFVTCHAWMRG